MRICFLLLGLVIGLPASSQTSPEAAGPAPRLTLDQALRLAEQANPELRAAEAGLASTQGELRDAEGLMWNNPVLSTESARRQFTPAAAPELRFNEWNVGLAQTFEIAGQRDYRRQAAELGLDASRQNVAETRGKVRAEVEQRFIKVLELQRRLELGREGLKLFENAAAVVGKRVQAGEDSRLDGNLAAVEAERARNQLALLGEQLLQARAELAASLLLPPAELPEAAGDLTVSTQTYTLAEILAQAATRPRLRSLALREQAAQSKLALERASTYPDITVGLTTGREGPDVARETLTTLSLSVPLPLFKRNAGGIGKATSELTQIQIERQATAREVEAQVRALWQKLESLRTRVQRLSTSVLPGLDENQRLSTVAARAGEIGVLQLLVVNRQLIEAWRDYLDAVAEFNQTRIALEQAAGWPPLASPP